MSIEDNGEAEQKFMNEITAAKCHVSKTSEKNNKAVAQLVFSN